LLSVLLVEDDAEHADIVEARLRDAGFRVERASTGPQAMARLEKGEPVSALVADFRMPAMSGLDLLKELRQRGFDHPFVLLTAHGGEEVAIEALRGGASDYLIKDVDLGYLDLIGPTVERAIEKLRFLRENLMLATALENTPAAVAITSPAGVTEYVNPAFEQLTGQRREEALGRPLRLAGLPAGVPEMSVEMRALIADGRPWQGEVESTRPDGRRRYVDLAVSAIKNPSGNLVNVIWTQHDITERKLGELAVTRVNKELRELAVKDDLTGTFNRRYLDGSLQREFVRARRYRLPFSILMIDIDRFKEANDRFGHPFGDYVLRTISDLMREASRETDIITRYGGEEFCLLLPNTDREGARNLAERIRSVVEGHVFEQGDRRAAITLSVGGVTLGESDAKSAQDLVDCADQALLRAKESGRNAVCLWPEAASAGKGGAAGGESWPSSV
jgi:diguanylate cyclase (GGDEF)-like protein/PAS domain S-box-containing protein